jgi:diguanylate cyclase (GGDEF)-like protein
MFEAIKEHKVKYDSESDEWGTFRSVYIPVLQKNGEYHLVGVDYSINKIEEMLRSEAITYFIYGFLVLIFSFPLLFITYSSLQQIVVELDKNFKNLADITSQYKQLSFQDQTTQIPNRRSFIENAKREINRSKRTEGDLFLAILDLDHFKRVNDTYGHNNGDIVLTAFGKLMQDSLRLEDIWGRWGGEEFVVMFNNKDMDSAVAVLERLRTLCEKNEMVISEDRKITITVSIGVSHVNINRTIHVEAEEILMDAVERADKQLYIAKETGRNKICSE